MKRVLVFAMVVLVLALMVSSVSAGGIRVDPGGANNVVDLMDDSMLVQGGKSTPIIFIKSAASSPVTADHIVTSPSSLPVFRILTDTVQNPPVEVKN